MVLMKLGLKPTRHVKFLHKASTPLVDLWRNFVSWCSSGRNQPLQRPCFNKMSREVKFLGDLTMKTQRQPRPTVGFWSKDYLGISQSGR